MRRRAHFLEALYCLLLLVFLAGRCAFLLYNRHVGLCSPAGALRLCRDGLLAHDMGVAAWLLALPWLAALASQRWGLPLRRWLTPYYIVMSLAVTAIVAGDTVMYEFWQFKLCAVVLSYAAYPEGAANSVSAAFIATRLGSALLLAAALCAACVWATPRRMARDYGARLWMRNVSVIWGFLLCAGALFTRVGDAYSPERTLYQNHAATNPVLAFWSSVRLSGDLSRRYNLLTEEERAAAFDGLYPENTDDITDTLLTTRRPDILFVLVESFGGEFVRELGGRPGVAPQLSRLIPQGVFWENYYSNSFRTDRGTASALCGWVSYPDVSLMLLRGMHGRLPSLARSLAGAGYSTSYLYPGPMTNMGKGQFLSGIGFRRLLDDKAFPPSELSGAWGADDGVSAMRACREVARADSARPFLLGYQTISSHEPWRVPYHRLDDEVLNAFAYTDECLGRLVDSLRATPRWDNLLIVMLPDHGHLYHQGFDDPEFYHSPMLWLGGAVRAPRRMAQLMNQSDLCATLLAQLGLGHAEYRWSRNVLSRRYTRRFAYCNSPAGVVLRDSTGVTVYDITADRPVLERPADGGRRARAALSILQTSYDELEEARR